MIVNFFIGIVGILFFLFIFWKRLKEDYSSEIIFGVAITILVGQSIGLLISYFFLPQYFFWLGTAGSLLGMFPMVFKYKLKPIETLEALFLGSQPFISLMFFKDSMINSSLNSFLAFVASLILIFGAYWFDVNYKSFSWYKSGKIGFAGIAIGIVFFLARIIVAAFGVSVISFVGKLDIWLSGSVFLILVGLLVYLGKNK